jgi:proline dehydrogenase
MAAPLSVQSLLFPLAKRFVAGDEIGGALAAVERLNSDGLSATIDVLGEDVNDAAAAARVREEYLRAIAALAGARAQANLSLKLSALGLLVDEATARRNFVDVLEAAAASLADPFVRIDMEGSALVDPTLAMFRSAFATHRNTGPVLQAYLHRTPADVAAAIALGARVRLCKGAYKEPPALALQRMADIRAQYLACARELLARGAYPGIATHDSHLIGAVRKFTAESGIAADRFEFQMLYGVRPELQRRLAADGYRVRVYVPYGSSWAKYFRRRVMERRENLYFAVRSVFSRG